MNSLTSFERRSALATAILSVFAGCTQPMPTEASVDSRVSLRPNQPVAIAEKAVTVNLVRVDDDSRCPADVQCVWSGNAAVVFTATFGNVPVVPNEQVVNTDIDPRSVTAGGYTFRLDSLLPRPLSTHVIAPEDYVAYMTVSATK